MGLGFYIYYDCLWRETKRIIEASFLQYLTTTVCLKAFFLLVVREDRSTIWRFSIHPSGEVSLTTEQYSHI